MTIHQAIQLASLCNAQTERIGRELRRLNDAPGRDQSWVAPTIALLRQAEESLQEIRESLVNLEPTKGVIP